MPRKFHAVKILCLKVSIAEGLSSEGMFKFSDVVEIQGQSECVTQKNVSDGK